jgi:hypothetical protein
VHELMAVDSVTIVDPELVDEVTGDLPEELTWQERALCAQTDPEAFFPEKGGSTREAKRVCMSCDVRPSASPMRSPTTSASDLGRAVRARTPPGQEARRLTFALRGAGAGGARGNGPGRDDAGGPVLTHAQGRPLARVTAILVVREDAAPRLPRTLAAVRDQTRPPDRLVGVDAGAGDAARGFLATLTPHLVVVPAGTVPGDAVRAALARLDAATLTFAATRAPRRRRRGGVAGTTRLTCGFAVGGRCAAGVALAAPRRLRARADALELLLAAVDTGPRSASPAASRSPGTTRAGCATSGSRRRARRPGDRCGRRRRRPGPARPPQRRPRGLGAGMLVRRDVWDALGGPDPAVGPRRPRPLPPRAPGRPPGRRRAAAVVRARRLHGRAPPTSRRPPPGPPRRPPPALRGDAVGPAAARAALGGRRRGRPRRRPPRAQAAGRGRRRGRRARARPRPPGAWLRAHRRAARTRRVPRRAYRRLLAPARQALRQRRDSLSAYVEEPADATAGTASAEPRAAADARPAGPRPRHRPRRRRRCSGSPPSPRSTRS